MKQVSTPYRNEPLHKLGPNAEKQGTHDQGEIESTSSGGVKHPVEAELWDR